MLQKHECRSQDRAFDVAGDFYRIYLAASCIGSSLEVILLAGHSINLANPDVTEANAAGKSLYFALQAACLFVHRAASSGAKTYGCAGL